MKTRFYVQCIFSENLVDCEIMREKCCRAGQATDESIILRRKDAIFTPDKYGKHTHTHIRST